MNHSRLQWKPSDDENLEMSGEGQHDLYEPREHGYSEHDRDMGYDREQKSFIPGINVLLSIIVTRVVYGVGEGSEREMGYISSEPSLQEFIPHQMDAENTPPPTGIAVIIITIIIIIIIQAMAATEVWTGYQWRVCLHWP